MHLTVEQMISADQLSRRRARRICAVAAAVVALALLYGASLWPRLPDEVPSLLSTINSRPTWVPKGIWSLYGSLLVVLGVSFLLPYVPVEPRGWEWTTPGAKLLSPVQRRYVLAPLREGVARALLGLALSLSLAALDQWSLAIAQAPPLPIWLSWAASTAGVLSALAAVPEFNRRQNAVLASLKPE